MKLSAQRIDNEEDLIACRAYACAALDGIMSCYRDYTDTGNTHEGRVKLATKYADLMLSQEQQRRNGSE